MTIKELLDYLYKEKEEAHKDFLYYNDLLLKVLTISTTLFVGVFTVGIQKELNLLICLLPFAILVILVIYQFVALLSYTSDNITRTYEQAINKRSKMNLSFKHSEIQNVFHDHNKFFGFSIEGMISALIGIGILGGFYILCCLKGYFWLKEIYPVYSKYYGVLVIVFPVLVFISFVISKNKLDKKLKVNSGLIKKQISLLTTKP